MNVDYLSAGTKLMWDAPEPFEGYAKNVWGRTDNRVIYPCVVTNRKLPNTSLTVHIKTGNNRGSFMCGDIPYLRVPTQEELETVTFPDPIYLSIEFQ